jgi:poly(3-hydroxybutyrate) depolymerase
VKGAKALYFESKATTQFACQYDSRFSYCAYIPDKYDENSTDVYSLAVIVHGSLRNAQQYRDAFIDFAEATNTIILAPLFPGGITQAWESDSYKFVRIQGVHFDEILLAMVDEIAQRYRVASDKFLLHGFSGGGQFTHRFYYLHPERLLGVSIGAPGNITVLDTTKPWYLGLSDYVEKFNVPFPIEAMRSVPVLMVVGSEDTETWMINDKSAPFWKDGMEETGNTRIERLRTLKMSFEQEGITVRHEEIAGLGHEGFKVLPTVKEFFTSILKK